ncbi:GrpE-like protein, mitochondrial [Smittium culicis]|uniref:GrpE protein homolog n=1 Tax=Smittium culicis TaxID=133412 RepID=A0A1R1X3K3_9FUNG|nr:GrpE-like protein, mitochondrial [Smittium culicis]
MLSVFSKSAVSGPFRAMLARNAASTARANFHSTGKQQEEQKEGDSKVAEYEKKIAEHEAKIKELKDNYLRALAECENLRTRYKNEVDNSKKFAIRNFSKDLIDTVDILHLAIKNTPAEFVSATASTTVVGAEKAIRDLSQGVDMTMKNLLKTLERHGVVQFNPLDQKFDPNTCHAVYQVPMPGKEPGSVFAVEKTGYKIHDAVLRPAQVGVVSESK